MLRNISELTGYVLNARDGEIGRCKDFLFDDEHWTIRYMVADTGKWLPKRKVLVSPASIDEPNWKMRRLNVRLTKNQIENAPLLADEEPVTRQYERAWAKHFGQVAYWVGSGLWGMGPHPGALYAGAREDAAELERDPTSDPHLRSTKEVKGYHIRAKDGEIGHVHDFIVDDRTWTIRYLVIDTRNWLPGRKVLVSPRWVTDVMWGEREVDVNLSQDRVRNAPEYDPYAPINREYEARLYDFHGRPVYWD
jgi:hypothetical protein